MESLILLSLVVAWVLVVDECNELFASRRCELCASSECGDGPGFSCTFDTTARPIGDAVDTSPPGIRKSDSGEGLVLFSGFSSFEEFALCTRSTIAAT